MAFTITVGKGVTTIVAGSQHSIKTSKHKQVILGVDYTNGDETTLDLTFQKQYPGLSNIQPLLSEKDSSDIMQTVNVKFAVTAFRDIIIDDLPESCDELLVNISSTGSTPTGAITLYGTDGSRI